MLLEMLVDFKLEQVNVQQKHVLMFLQRQMMQLVKHIYQVVIYQQQQHVQLQKQEPAHLIQLQEQPMLTKQPFAIHY